MPPFAPPPAPAPTPEITCRAQQQLEFGPAPAGTGAEAVARAAAAGRRVGGAAGDANRATPLHAPPPPTAQMGAAGRIRPYKPGNGRTSTHIKAQARMKTQAGLIRRRLLRRPKLLRAVQAWGQSGRKAALIASRGRRHNSCFIQRLPSGRPRTKSGRCAGAPGALRRGRLGAQSYCVRRPPAAQKVHHPKGRPASSSPRAGPPPPPLLPRPLTAPRPALPLRAGLSAASQQARSMPPWHSGVPTALPPPPPSLQRGPLSRPPPCPREASHAHSRQRGSSAACACRVRVSPGALGAAQHAQQTTALHAPQCASDAYGAWRLRGGGRLLQLCLGAGGVAARPIPTRGVLFRALPRQSGTPVPVPETHVQSEQGAVPGAAAQQTGFDSMPPRAAPAREAVARIG
jgi:hypothetical protein